MSKGTTLETITEAIRQSNAGLVSPKITAQLILDVVLEAAPNAADSNENVHYGYSCMQCGGLEEGFDWIINHIKSNDTTRW